MKVPRLFTLGPGRVRGFAGAAVAAPGAVAALPFEKSQIGQLRNLADQRRTKQEGTPSQAGQLAPDGREGIDADLPGTVAIARMKLSEQIRAALARGQLPVGERDDVDPVNPALPVDAAVERHLLAADRAIAVVPDGERGTGGGTGSGAVHRLKLGLSV